MRPGIRIGIDLVHIPSFQLKLDDPDFVARVFHDAETADGRAEHLAGVFAAKEALFKAVNEVSGWLDVQVVSGEKGPCLFVPELGPDCDVVLSVTHEREYACAVVVVHEKRA